MAYADVVNKVRLNCEPYFMLRTAESVNYSNFYKNTPLDSHIKRGIKYYFIQKTEQHQT